MPIFARTKMIIHDDCWDVSGPKMKFEYSGPNPQLAYSKIKELFVTVFHIRPEERAQEKDFKWNRNGNKEDFSAKWDVSKDMDRNTYVYITIGLSGHAETTDQGKTGKFTVDIDGFIRTEYPQDTLWERSIFYEITRVLWHKVFYTEKRREYHDVCRKLMATFKSELQSFFNLVQRGA